MVAEVATSVPVLSWLEAETAEGAAEAGMGVVAEMGVTEMPLPCDIGCFMRPSMRESSLGEYRVGCLDRSAIA